MKALLQLVDRVRPRLPTASLRTYLLVVILLAVAPIAIYTSYRIFAEANDRHAQMLDNLQRSAASLSQNVERELASTVAALNIVSNRDSLQHGDLAAFESALARHQLRPSWRAVFLTDLRGDVLFDTSVPDARRLYSTADTLDYAQMIAQPAMMVSNIVANRFPGQFTTAIAVPVAIDGALRYVLGVWIDVPVWQDVIAKAAVPARGFATMVDRDYRVIARTIDPARSTGLRATSPSIRLIAGHSAGVERTQMLEGTDSYVGWETVPTSGWTTVVGMPASERDAQIRGLIQAALVITLGCLALGGGLAVLVARHLTVPLSRLSGELATPTEHIAVREIARLRDALRDAHERDALARERLERKADEFQTLFDSSPIGLAFAQDPQCRSVIHNAAMDRLVGTANALMGREVQVRRLGHRLETNQLPLQRAAASGESVPPVELDIVVGDRLGHIVAQAVGLRESDGRPRGAIAAVFDITERRQAELRLTKADRQLVESQRLIDLAQDAGHVGFLHYRYAAGLLTWSPGQARLFGLDHASSDMPLHNWLRLIRRDDRAHARKALRRSLAAGEETHTIEFRVDAPDGTLRWLSSRLVTHYDARRRPLETVGVTIDMTTQKLAERERTRMAERERSARLEAEAANRVKDEFLAMLSHELRNPLGAISSAVEVLKRLEPTTGVGAQARDIIARQTSHLAQLVGDLLDVARVTSGKILLSRHKQDLANLAQRLTCALQLTGMAQAHDLQLDLHEVWVDADATRIEQIISNLLCNAVKHVPPGGRIRLEVRPDGEEALLAVYDNGPGIPPKLLPRVFDLFVQGERTVDRRIGGLGIGLTLARRLVELHGGSINAVSSPREGTTFTVRLPAVRAPRAARDAVQPKLPPRRRIVLVEDNEDALDALQAVLEIDGHTVWAASDGVSGLASILEVRPDVALVDIGLPGLTGLEVATQSRAAGYAGRMIALSGYGQDSDIRKSQMAGFDDHLVKPVDSDGLRRVLMNI